MNPTAGSFTINPRLQRHFAVFAISFPGLDALKTIYLSILNGHINAAGLPQAVQKNSEKLVDAAVAMNQKVRLFHLVLLDLYTHLIYIVLKCQYDWKSIRRFEEFITMEIVVKSNEILLTLCHNRYVLSFKENSAVHIRAKSFFYCLGDSEEHSGMDEMFRDFHERKLRTNTRLYRAIRYIHG